MGAKKTKSEVIAYYVSLRDKFSLWDKEGNSPMPGQCLFNKETNVFWGPITCRENGINFTNFKNGQLEYRLENNNADY